MAFLRDYCYYYLQFVNPPSLLTYEDHAEQIRPPPPPVYETTLNLQFANHLNTFNTIPFTPGISVLLGTGYFAAFTLHLLGAQKNTFCIIVHPILLLCSARLEQSDAM